MSAEISLFSDPDSTLPVETIALAETTIEGEVGHGTPYRVYGKNTGDTAIREVSIALRGEGASNVQLAIDGEPQIWAAPGESIVIEPGTLLPGQEFLFWSRAVYEFDDAEGAYPFEFVVRGTSVG